MKRLLVAAALAWGLTASAQPLTGGLLGRSSSGTSTPATCTTAGQVPIFLGSPLALGCDAGLTYDAGSDVLTVGTGAGSGDISLGAASPYGVVLGRSITGVQMGSAGGIFWSSANAYGTGVLDSGLRRVSAGLVGVTSGGDNLGSLRAGNVTATALATPTVTSPLTVNGTPGATTYGYKAVAFLNDGTSSAASPEVTIATGPAVLNGTDNITVAVPAVTGMAYYNLYRTTGGTAPPKLIYSGTTPSYIDTGTEISASTPPTVNTTGGVRAAMIHLTSADAPTDPGYTNLSAVGDSVVVQAAGSKIFAVEGLATVPGHSKGIRLSGDASLTWVNGTSPETEEPDTGFQRIGTRSLTLGNYYTATPSAQNFLIGDIASGTNIAGKIQTITAQPGTGTGIGSALYFYTSIPYGTSNSTPHAQGLRMSIDSASIGFNLPIWTVNQFPGANDYYSIGSGSYAHKNLWLTQGVIGSKTKNLTSGVAATFATFPLTGYKTGEITYHIVASRFSALQARKGRVQFAAVLDNGVYSVSVTEMGTSAMAGAGTLTGDVGCTCAANVCTLTFTYTSSLTTPSMLASYRFDNLEDIVPTIVP